MVQFSISPWPSSDSAYDDLASGANCLLLLVRCILMATDDDDYDQSIIRNPFFNRALLDLSDPSEALNNLRSIADELWNKELQDVPAAMLTFSSLVSSEVMLPVWSKPLFHPWRKPLWKTMNEGFWHAVTAANTPGVVVDVVQAALDVRPGTFCLAAFPGMSLERQVNAQFGISFVQGIYLIYPAMPSIFFYANFNVDGVDGNNKLSFDEFRSFQVNTISPTQHTLMRVRYNLTAIVKHRNGADRGDSIRIYSRYGRPEIPDTASLYANPHWRLDNMQNGDSFFAMFAVEQFESRTDPPFPETAEESDPETAEELNPDEINHAYDTKFFGFRT